MNSNNQHNDELVTNKKLKPAPDKERGDCINNEIVTSKKLKLELDRERGDCIPEINGDTNTLARRDKSFANFIDFYLKLIKKNKNKEI